MDYNKAALEMHETHHGKVGITSKVEVKTRDDLSTAYTPGVAEPCRKIKENPDDVYKYTFKGNMVAVVSNGTAVLGLGDIGPEAGLPVMEGKAVLFKEFGGVDAFPICIDAQDVYKRQRKEFFPRDTKMCFPPWLFRDEKHINVTCYNIIFRTPMQALQMCIRDRAISKPLLVLPGISSFFSSF